MIFFTRTVHNQLKIFLHKWIVKLLPPNRFQCVLFVEIPTDLVPERGRWAYPNKLTKSFRLSTAQISHGGQRRRIFQISYLSCFPTKLLKHLNFFQYTLSRSSW